MTKWVLLAVGLGLLIGRFSGPHLLIPEWIDFVAFSIMLFGIGLELGQDRALWRRLRHGGWRILLFPVNVVIGSWFGGLIAGLILGLGATKTIAIASGFGWYSLAAVLTNQLDGPRMAAIAFVANVLRELLSFTAIPWVARLGRGSVAVSLGGATSMDTTLPLVTRYTNPEVGLYAFVSGVITSLLVPIFIPLWMQL